MLLRRQHATRMLSTITPADEKMLGSLCASITTDPNILASFNTDWTGAFRGQSRLLLRPTNVTQVKDCLAYANSRGLKVVPQGGNTGLVGGAVPLHDEIIMSLTNLKTMIHVDNDATALTCDAGFTLEQADTHARQHNFIFPLDIGSRGSAQVGGNISTNAGGMRFLRYGSLRGNVLGLQAVLADGTILDNIKTIRKDNTGYDLNQLFIGSEGTLGIVTRICTKIYPLPQSQIVAMLRVKSFENALAILTATRTHLGEILSAYEYFDAACMNLVLDASLSVTLPFDSRCQDDSGCFYLIIETSGSKPDHDVEKFAILLETLERDGLVEEHRLALDSRRCAELWKARELIAVALRSKGGKVFKYDVSLPISLMNAATRHVESKMNELGIQVKIFQYGHLGDGNLHFNAFAGSHMESQWGRTKSMIESTLYEFVSRHGGSVSAEHGIGQLKVKCLGMSKSAPAISAMKTIKKALDPHCTLNPGKVF